MKLNPDYPVFANTRPWNELILRDVRKFKTLSFNWSYRGIIYLYDTKGRADEYGFSWGDDHGCAIPDFKGYPGCIVGAVEVYGMRGGEDCEENYNGYEVLIRKPQRFPNPIPFKYTGRGRIARIR